MFKWIPAFLALLVIAIFPAGAFAGEMGAKSVTGCVQTTTPDQDQAGGDGAVLALVVILGVVVAVLILHRCGCFENLCSAAPGDVQATELRHAGVFQLVVLSSS